MTKRIISLFLVCILAIPIVAVPASATNVTTTTDAKLDSTQYNGIVSILDKIREYLYFIKAGTDTIMAWCSKIHESVSSLQTSITDHLANYWAKMAAWLLVFWNGDEDLGVTGLLPTINQGYSTISGVLGTLDATVDKGIVKLYSRLGSISDLISSFDTSVSEAFSTITDKVSSIYALCGQHLGAIRQYTMQTVNAVKDGFKDLIDLVRGDSTAGDDFKDKTDDITDSLNPEYDVTYPKYDDVDIDLPSLLPENPTGTISTFFQFFFSSDTYLYFVWTLVFTFSLMSFVLFGKR